MCGIIGIASNKPVSTNIINSLKKLEYRGYDSAGVAFHEGHKFSMARETGRVKNLAESVVCWAIAPDYQ